MLSRIVVLLIAAVLLACSGPAGSVGRQAASTGSAGDGASARAMNIVIRGEPQDLTDSASAMNSISLALFGANLVDIDRADAPYPVLATATPELDTDSWRLLPDGRMETTYALRPGLTWHDGTPLTADDF